VHLRPELWTLTRLSCRSLSLRRLRPWFIILLTPKEKTLFVRVVAATATFISLALAIYNFPSPTIAMRRPRFRAGYQFQAVVRGCRRSASDHVGVDGIGLTMVLLTGVVGFMGVLIFDGTQGSHPEFMAFSCCWWRASSRVRLAGLVPVDLFYELSSSDVHSHCDVGSTRKSMRR